MFQPTAAPPANSGGSRVLVGVLVALCLLLVLGGTGAGAWWFLNEKNEDELARATEMSAAERELEEERKRLASERERLEAERAAGGDSDEVDEVEEEDEDEPDPRDSDDDPLSVGADFVNPSCTGDYVVVLASSGDPDAYVSTLEPALESTWEAQYLRTSDSCSAFNQEIKGNDIYAAYLGPFDDEWEACAARHDLEYGGSYVRQLDADAERRTPCSCTDAASNLPILSEGDGGASDASTGLYVADLQSMLITVGYNKDKNVGGNFGPATTTWVRRFQRREDLDVDGVVGVETWSRLQDYC